MNLNIKATGTREEIAAMFRELATKLETGQTPEGAEELAELSDVIWAALAVALFIWIVS